ncbi:MAG: hypothetical protein HYY48_01275 [Gammaproteobacteria bacterium]|nr:hypothetical protein [Gammaproteobacteria bacterium]
MAATHVFTAPHVTDEFRPDRTQVMILYSQSAVTFLFPVVASLALCLLLWDVSPRRVLLGWETLVIVYSVARYGLLWRFRSVTSTCKDFRPWHAMFALCVFLSGVLWGVAPILLVPYEPARLVEFTLYNGLIVLTISGLVAGAVIAYGVSIRVLLCYVLPALIPPALYLIQLGDKYNSALGGFILLYLLFIGSSCVRVRNHFMHFIRAEYDCELLRHELEALRHRTGLIAAESTSGLFYEAHFPPR